LKLGYGKVVEQQSSSAAVGTIAVSSGLSRTTNLPSATVVGIVTALVASTAPELLPCTNSADFAVATSWMTNASQTLGVFQVREQHPAVDETALETARSGTLWQNLTLYSGVLSAW
jgi:hypothetical protein